MHVALLPTILRTDRSNRNEVVFTSWAFAGRHKDDEIGATVESLNDIALIEAKFSNFRTALPVVQKSLEIDVRNLLDFLLVLSIKTR